MYKTLKKIIQLVLPKKLLFGLEPIFRFFIFQTYKGTGFSCPICRKSFKQFINLEDGDKLCPSCGSIARTRRLYSILDSKYLKSDINFLDFSPSRSLYRFFKKQSDLNYIGTDLSNDFISDVKYDVTQINSADSSFDLITCYHILEHIPNDVKAMQELFRVLKPTGTCIIQTPFKSGETYENEAVKTDAERLEHFGQIDHVRIYSVEGLKNRLMNVGFHVEVLLFNELPNNELGYQTEERILICTK